jgi:Retrotransposon gag protein
VNGVIRDIHEGIDLGGNRNNNQIWTEFQERFENHFTDTAAVEKALSELAALDLQNDDIDSYITKFESLVCRCGYLCSDPGVLKMFKDRLRKGVTAKIYSCNVWPLTLDEWQAATH